MSCTYEVNASVTGTTGPAADEEPTIAKLTASMLTAN